MEQLKIQEEAAVWLMRMEHDPSSQTRTEFDRWIRQGAVYAQEYLLAKATWTQLRQLDGTFRLAAAGEGDAVVAFPTQTQRHAAPKLRLNKFAIAASLLLVIAAAAFSTLWMSRHQSYTTAKGAQESVQLSDGSVMYLNTHSRATVHFSAASREVRLIQGEALFKVAQDSSRPFVVITEGVRIRAVGTQFNVYRSTQAATRIAVLEGRVQVTTPDSDPHSKVQLAAGEEVQVERGRVLKPVTANVQRAVAWRARRLMFDDVNGARVDEIAREFNRYNRIPIRIQDESIRARRMGGTFDADDPTPFIRFLSKDAAIAIEKTDSQIVVRAR